MQVWKAIAIKTVNDGKRKITPGMSVEFTTDYNSDSKSVWTRNSTKRRIAEEFVYKYNLKCSASEFEIIVNNVNFEYTLLSK